MELKGNITTCVSDMATLRLFKMKRIAVGGEQDSTILMGNTGAVGSHVDFRRDQCAHYSYECKLGKMSHYVYNLMKILCYQCVLLSWDDFRR